MLVAFRDLATRSITDIQKTNADIGYAVHKWCSRLAFER